jgi:hypothetical protein
MGLIEFRVVLKQQRPKLNDYKFSTDFQVPSGSAILENIFEMEHSDARLNYNLPLYLHD